MSTKMTGAPSTNPPAVIGRDLSSLTAGRAAPVETPVDGPVCCCVFFWSAAFCANTVRGEIAAAMNSNRAAPATRLAKASSRLAGERTFTLADPFPLAQRQVRPPAEMDPPQ